MECLLIFKKPHPAIPAVIQLMNDSLFPDLEGEKGEGFEEVCGLCSPVSQRISQP